MKGFDHEKFCAMMRIARCVRGLGFPEAARLSGVSASTIRNIETGRRAGQITKLLWLCETYRVKLSELMAKCEGR